jgi:hypothetical protein
MKPPGRKLRLEDPIGFTEKPLGPISLDRPADLAPGDNPQAAIKPGAEESEHHKAGTMECLPVFEDMADGAAFGEPFFSWKPVTRGTGGITRPARIGAGFH